MNFLEKANFDWMEMLNFYERPFRAKLIPAKVWRDLDEYRNDSTGLSNYFKKWRTKIEFRPPPKKSEVWNKYVAVGGAGASSRVVSIPNFAFGGGKRGTMIANTSEYIVPNFANGGSAIFNKDMVRSYGLPAGAKKISAAGGYVPNFARYVYDADRIQPDKNALLKAILASGAKKNLIVGPAGSGKSTYGASLGSFITNVGQLADATEIDILSGAARTKDGGISKNFQQIADAVNMSGGKISYLYAGNMDILSRRMGRIGEGPSEGDLRSKKQIAGSMYAPLNQFDFISKVKGAASNFEMVRGAKGYIPNFAEYSYFNLKPEFAASGLPIEFSTVRSTANKDAQAKIAEYVKAKGMDPQTAISSLYTSRKGMAKTGLTVSSIDYPGGAVMLLPDQAMAQKVNAESMGVGIQPKEGRSIADFVKFKAYGFSQSSIDNLAKKSGGEAGIIGSISDSVASVIYGEGSRIVNLFKPLTKTPINNTSFKEIYDKKGGAGGAAKAVAGSIFEAAMDYALNPKDSPEARKAISAAEGKTFDVLNFQQAQLLREAFGATGAREAYADYKISDKRDTAFADQIILNSAYPKVAQKASIGYIPNFAAGSPLGDAINREMAAGVSPNKIRITQDGRLRNAGNPNGLAVINTRDEPNGKIPNFAEGDISEKNGHYYQEIGGKKVPIKASVGAALKAKQEEAMLNPPQSTKSGPRAATVDQNNKKFQLTTEKLMASFVTLQVATSTLQSTFKDTDSAVAKALNAFGQISTSTAGYGTLGSMLGEGLKGRGGILGKLSGGAGVAGLAVGGVLGTISSISDYLDEKQRIADTKRKTAGQSDIANLLTQNAGLGEEGQREALRAARQQMEENLPEARLVLNSEKIANLQNQINNYKTKELELTTAISLKNLKDSQEREAAQKREKEELNSRIALEKTRISLNEAFAKNQLMLEKERNNRQLEYLRIELSLSEFQKNILRNREELTRLEEKEAELNAESVKNIIEKIRGTSQLTSTDALRVSMLESELKAGKKIQDVQKTINDLRIQGVSSLAVILMNELSNLKIAKDKVGEELRYTEQRQKNVLLAQTDLSAQQLLLQITSDRLEREREIFDIRLESGVDLNLTENQRELLKLREKIASQAFATPEQEAQLARLTLSTEQYSNVLKANVDFLNKRNSIFRTTQKDFASIFDEAGPLKFLSQQTRNNLKNSILSATDLSDIKGNLQMNFEDIDSMLADIDMSGISEEEIQNLRENFSKTISAVYNNLLAKLTTANAQMDYAEQKRNTAIDQTRQLLTYEEKINIFREKNGLAATGLVRAFSEIDKQAKSFSETLSYDTTLAFRDGLKDAMSAAISQTDDLGGALQNVAMNFLKTMQNAFLQNAANNMMLGLQGAFPSIFPKTFAKGGLVSGGSGYRDDVPAMLTGGEFVMRKSAVQKYGAANLAKMNNGGIFLPGVRGGGNITGYDQLRAFANQTTTSGATDVLRGGGSSAFINPEDQSSRLSRFGLLNEDTINQEIRSAQEQGLDIIAKREAYRTQQRKAFQQQLVGTILSAAASYGAAKIGSMGQTINPKAFDAALDSNLSPEYRNLYSITNMSGARNIKLSRAYGGMIRRYASGGPTDDIPALLMSGEYVMNRGATSKYGKRLLDSMNQGRAPRFADGGEVGASTTTTESNAKMMGDVSININVTGQNSQTETQGNTSQGGIDYKKMSERIKAVVS